MVKKTTNLCYPCKKLFQHIGLFYDIVNVRILNKVIGGERMDRYEKFEHWKDIAEYDLRTAEAMLSSGRYLYVVFMCEQAVEKYIKGLFVLANDAEPPRTHDIERIFNKVPIEQDELFESRKENYGLFFQSLRGYYLTDR